MPRVSFDFCLIMKPEMRILSASIRTVVVTLRRVEALMVVAFFLQRPMENEWNGAEQDVSVVLKWDQSCGSEVVLGRSLRHSMSLIGSR